VKTLAKQFTMALPDEIVDRMYSVREEMGIPLSQQIRRALPLFWAKLESGSHGSE